ncbi:RND transporter [Planctomycetales bacterium]|nr:RND transporter [Planctomycetales bacterium]GHS98463.1 RND transporter [Planctomycetales bacterium]GHT05886.1 RND transporter [Planctomycetales bacterium]
MLKKFGLLSLLVAVGGVSAGEMAPAAVLVAVDRAVALDESGVKKYVGAVEPIEDVTLRARVSGRLESINFTEGDKVKAGDLLFEIEKDIYEAEYQEARALLEQTHAALVFAEQNHARQVDLSKQKVVAKKELEDAERALRTAKAADAAAKFKLVVAEKNFSYSRVVAPISGRIGKAAYTRGNYLNAATTPELATIVQTAPIYVRFAMSEPDFASMFGGNAENCKKEAVVRARAADRTMLNETGAVTLVDNRIDPATGTIKIWATFANADEILTPGGMLDVIITKKTAQKVAAVKVTAVLMRDNGHYVYVVGADNKPELRAVEVGDVIGDLQVITQGVEAGETVVVEGTHKIMPGGAIRTAGSGN